MGVILLAMTIGGLLVAAVLLALSYFTKLAWLRNFVFGGVTVWLSGYLILLLIASVFSQEETLGLNQPKEFCGFYLDCHMHSAVTDVRKTKMLGDRTANGEFYVVKVKVFSDAKQATLGLIAVDARVSDGDGKTFMRDEAAEKAIGEQPPFDRRISPTESFEREIVFDLPVNVQNARLDIREGYGIDHLIEAVVIGDEDSIFHKRKYFKVGASEQVAGK